MITPKLKEGDTIIKDNGGAFWMALVTTRDDLRAKHILTLGIGK